MTIAKIDMAFKYRGDNEFSRIFLPLLRRGKPLLLRALALIPAPLLKRPSMDGILAEMVFPI